MTWIRLAVSCVIVVTGMSMLMSLWCSCHFSMILRRSGREEQQRRGERRGLEGEGTHKGHG